MSFARSSSARRHFVAAALSATCLTSIAAAQQDCIFAPVPTPVVVVQKDGAEVALHLRASAAARWYEDDAGYPVVESSSGYVYARVGSEGELVPTEWLAGRAQPAELGLRAHVVPKGAGEAAGAGGLGSKGPRTAGPSTGGGAFALGSGSVKNLVILMRFSNHGPSGQNRTLPSNTDVGTIMNAVGGDPVLAPTGSVRDHYLETSYGQFTINSTVVGWLDAPNTEVYYANGNSGLTTRTWELITAGLNLADATVDFSQFDEDGDGWIDAITFLHSGYGAEWGGTDQYGTTSVNRMWSHKWEIPTWTSAEGVKVGPYNISPGLWSTSGSSPGRIGVVCHELGHFFGLPDLYDTGGVGGSSQGIGNWCLMAAGSWGFDSSQQYPSHMSAWSKSKLGWASPQILLPGNYSAPQVEFNSSLFRIDSGYPPGEYLLVENRQKVGFDLQIPQGGLAIWHVDESKGSLSDNTPNNDEGFPGQSGWPGNNKHYRVALLQADGGYDMEHNSDRGDAGDVYRSGGVSSITSATTPNTNAYQGGTILTNGNAISSIGASGANMAFTYASASSPAITTGSLPSGTVASPYSQTLASSGGTAPITWMEYVANPSYSTSDLGPGAFAMGGTAQTWRSDDNVWSLNLPFAFPYWERSYTTVYVSSNGFLEFSATNSEYGNSLGYLRANLRIAAIWDDLTTAGTGDDIFVDTGTPGQVRIRWKAKTVDGGNVCNFAVRIYSDGRIDLEYGAGNTGLTPNVGVSRGHSGGLVIPDAYDGASSLTNANTLRFTLLGSQVPPGLSLSTAGVLSGTPTTNGLYQPIFRATDSVFRYGHKTLPITIGGGCDVNTSNLSPATVCEGLTNQFCTTASGTGPFTYSWTKNGSTIGGATASCYTATAGTEGVVDNYCVTVSGGCGTPLVRCASLTALSDVDATALTPAAVCQGQTAQFCTTASGTGPYSYSWTKNGSTIGGATSSCYTATAGTGGTVDNYCVTVTGACGPAAQRCATLTANANVSASALAPVALCEGQTHAFCTSASGTGPFSYSWTRNGITIAGANGSCYTATADLGGVIDDYCVTVSGACGPAVQRCATLTSQENTSATPLAPATVSAGSTHGFCTTASGTGPLTYEWTKNGAPIAGATDDCYTATAGSSGTSDEYCVTVHGACGADVTECGTLTAGLAAPFCFGDGSGAACPCGNSGAPGRGCMNSAGQSALLTAAGTTTPDTLVFTATGELPTALTIFLQGTTTIAPIAYGDGIRCFGGALKRLYAKGASGGTVSAPTGADLPVTARSAQLGDTIPSGGTRYYMTYYRDSNPGWCAAPQGSTFNGSNALTIVW